MLAYAQDAAANQGDTHIFSKRSVYTIVSKLLGSKVNANYIKIAFSNGGVRECDRRVLQEIDNALATLHY